MNKNKKQNQGDDTDPQLIDQLWALLRKNKKAAILTALLSTGGGGTYAVYDLALDFLNMPREIQILRWRQEQLLRIALEHELIDQHQLFRMFFTPVDSMALVDITLKK